MFGHPEPFRFNLHHIPINRFQYLPTKDIIRFIARAHERYDIVFEGLYVYGFLQIYQPPWLNAEPRFDPC